MKTKLYILTFFILLSGVSFSQSIRDTVFNNVIPIPYQYITTDGTDFLIDVPLKVQKEPLVIFNNDRRIPVHLFFESKSFIYGQNEIILITPDWEHQESIIKEQKEKGIHIKPVRQNKFYHIQKNNTENKVDSLSIRMDDPRKPITINFKKLGLIQDKKYYYVGCHSYNDIQNRNIWKDLDSLNMRFNIYEGFYSSQDCMYYSLYALPLENKLPAIKAITEIVRFKDNDHLKDFDQSPKIYLPTIINPDSFDFYFESSKDSPDNPTVKGWQEKGNTAILRLGYWRGDCCGDVPETERVSAKIINDTVFINYNLKREQEPNCDPSIGVCGNAIDFVINKKKYPNYKNLTFKTIE